MKFTLNKQETRVGEARHLLAESGSDPLRVLLFQRILDTSRPYDLGSILSANKITPDDKVLYEVSDIVAAVRIELEVDPLLT